MGKMLSALPYIYDQPLKYIAVIQSTFDSKTLEEKDKRSNSIKNGEDKKI
jgi:hypothetical protein